jgi:hypothetical protein
MSNSLQLYSNSMQTGFAMIDKADLRVKRNVPFTREFQQVYEASQRGEKRPWGSSRYFASTADLRGFGYDVRLHMYSTLTPEPIHKLEIYDAGEKTYQEMHSLAASIFDCNPDRLGLMRVDLCADLHGIDVGWFKRHTIVQSKQTQREFGTVAPYQTVRKGKAETLYAGVKPNQFRIYNKSAERQVRWKWYVRQLRRQAPELEPTPYEVMYGHPSEAVITRVERQIAGRDLERVGFSTFESLKAASSISPFKKIVFYEAGQLEPSMEEYGFAMWTSGMYLRSMVRDFGLAAARGFMKEKLGRNLYRDWKRFEPFLRLPTQTIGIDSANLYTSFQQSVSRQLFSAPKELSA